MLLLSRFITTYIVCDHFEKHVNINTAVMTLYLCRLLCLQGGASTALMIAAEQGSCDIITVLLEHGADINAVNTVGIEPNVVTV